MSRYKKQSPGYVRIVRTAYLKPDGTAATDENVDVSKDIAHSVLPEESRPNRRLRREQESARGKKKRQSAFTKWLHSMVEKHIRDKK